MSINKNAINTESFLPISSISTAITEYVDEVLELSKRAKSYIATMPWCSEILNGWLGWSCGYIIGVFYFQFKPARPEIPHFVWIVVGDLPPAYLDVEYNHTVTEVIDGYVSEMQVWVDRVMNGLQLDDSVIPVNVPPEKEWANRLNTRLELLRRDILETGNLPGEGEIDL